MDFKLPEIGEGVQEGELIKWKVKEGDTVTMDQALLEVMTDKATVEIPSPTNGVIKGIQTKEGQMIKVGQVLATIDAAAGATKAATANGATTATKAPAPAATLATTTTTAAAPTPAAAAPTPATPTPAPAKSQAWFGPASSDTAPNAGVAAPYKGATEAHAPSSVPAAPIVRAMAQKVGVDLSQVTGTGPEVGGRNRVLEDDLLQYLAQRSAGTTTATAPTTRTTTTSSQEVERKPIRGLRRLIAQAMVKSKYTAPHYSYVDEFECSSLVDIREQAKVIGEKNKVKVSYLPFVVKALVGALREFPECNSSLEETANGMELVIKKFYNIGFACSTPDGLVVPVIKNADKKSLLDISREINELSEKCRMGKATSEELKGSTFTVTSMGNVGGLFATPIINYPEVGILGVYRVQEKPIVKNGQIVIGKTMHLSLSLDHRVVDGAVGGYFCNAIIERLANPARLLMDLT